MCFIDEEYSFEVGVVYFFLADTLMVGSKFLNVHYHNFWSSTVVCDHGIALEVVHQRFAVLCLANNESAVCEFGAGLLKEVKAVNNEVEFDRSVLCCKVVSEALDVVVCKCCLSGALSVPDNTGVLAMIKCFPDGVGREELLVTHDVLFQSLDLGAIFFLFCGINVCNTVFENEEKTVL